MKDSLIRTEIYKKGRGPKPADFADSFYISEINYQCEFAFRTFEEMRRAYSDNKQHPSLLALAHTLLVFAGNVAKLLSSTKNSQVESRNRVKRLRETLKLNVDFSQVRAARNYFEHFDERIDSYVGSTKGLLIGRLIQDHLPLSINVDGKLYKPNFLQFFNTTTGELTLYDQEFKLLEIVNTLESIQTAAKKWMNDRPSQDNKNS